MSSAGLASRTPACPAVVTKDGDGWPFDEVIRTGKPMQVSDLEGRFGPLQSGPYPESPQVALVLPLMLPGHEKPAAILIAGVSPRLALNDAYRDFYTFLACAVTGAFANARAFAEERARAEALAELDRAKTTFFSSSRGGRADRWRAAGTATGSPRCWETRWTTRSSSRVVVHNWGRPILADRLAAVFEPFQRAEPTANARASLELGLYISQQIALAHRGSLEATSSAERGTTFTLTLPRLCPSLDEADGRLSAAASRARESSVRAGARVGVLEAATARKPGT